MYSGNYNSQQHSYDESPLVGSNYGYGGGMGKRFAQQNNSNSYQQNNSNSYQQNNLNSYQQNNSNSYQQNNSGSYQQNTNVPFYTLTQSDGYNYYQNHGGDQSSSTAQYSAAYVTQGHQYNTCEGNYSEEPQQRNRKNEYQTWVKRDSLKRHAPYSSYKGVNMLQKMGWNPGQGLGRSQNGALEPHMPDIKMNKRGFDVSKNEIQVAVPARAGKKGKVIGPQVSTLKIVTEGKSPISILEEYCSKRRLPPPKYEAIVDEGPIHAKKYVFKITIEDVDFPAQKSSHIKKEARAFAAKECLIKLGILKPDPETAETTSESENKEEEVKN